ncbi:transcriptional repressor protein KorC [Escherichia coli]|uniref:transcriptional repressor protein KorC n=1 Tax=Escherichia coli TaxID=562 RepID=UPI0039BD5AB7
MNNVIRTETLLPFSDGWTPPTGEEIKAVLSLVEERAGNKFTGVDASKYIGLPSETGRGKGSRTFRRWCKEGGIPYAAWALLCYKAGFGVIWESDEQRGEN